MSADSFASSMRRRGLTAAEQAQLDREVAELAWRWARRLTGLSVEQAPLGPVDPGIPEADRATAHLARLYLLAKIRNSADARADADALYAGQAGADYPQIAAALGLT
ncbi:MAG TPA: hypothetical protein VGM60_18160 [Pseudonocardia sp.]|jgi:hypothetical protein|uniref:hypothetical protein n=1 Tax=Pseudonocardia sp. TaxID=60912 RepID=UPI002F3FF10B